MGRIDGGWSLEISATFPPQASPPSFNFGGDTRSDRGVWLPENGLWFTLITGGAATVLTQFGEPTDIPVPADYDGDGVTDPAIFRPTLGLWYAQLSGGGILNAIVGQDTLIPIPADYDGDGRADLATFNPAIGSYFVLRSTGGTTNQIVPGTAGGLPFAIDLDSDGKADHAALWNGERLVVRYSSGGTDTQSVRFVTNPIPVPGDYLGDEREEAMFWGRIQNGQYHYFTLRLDGGFVEQGQPIGQDGDIPIPADYDGDGKFDRAIYRPSTGRTEVVLSTTGVRLVEPFGNGDDIPLQKRPSYPRMYPYDAARPAAGGRPTGGAIAGDVSPTPPVGIPRVADGVVRLGGPSGANASVSG